MQIYVGVYLCAIPIVRNGLDFFIRDFTLREYEFLLWAVREIRRVYASRGDSRRFCDRHSLYNTQIQTASAMFIPGNL